MLWIWKIGWKNFNGKEILHNAGKISASIAKELASRNIRANAVAPGFIDTDMTSVLSDEVKENINSQIPMKRMGTAREIANVVYFLGSEESSYITGQVINIDGGMVC